MLDGSNVGIGNNNALETAQARWKVNADELATFLSGANPEHWPLAVMKSEMRMHLDLTLSEATARLRGDFAEDIRQFDAIHEHILNMADVLSNGIVAQFPDRFDRER